MNEHKQEIISTRTGCVGGSDAKMLVRIAHLGSVPESAKKRLAIVKGLIEQENIVTPAMAYGDFIEDAIFNHISQGNDEFQSNPLWESKKYSRNNVKLICHPDFVFEDKEKKIIHVYECKATRYSLDATKSNYLPQIFVESTLAEERAEELGNDWKVNMYLVHYDTSDVDLNAEFEFNPEKVKVCKLKTRSNVFDIGKAMDIVNDYLETLDVYTEDEVVDANYLPESVHSQFKQVANYLREIKEREDKVKQFKDRLYKYLSERNIQKVQCDDFSFTVVSPTSSVSVDYKKIFENEIESKHPRKANKLKDKFKKTSNRSGYVLIKVNE